MFPTDRPDEEPIAGPSKSDPSPVTGSDAIASEGAAQEQTDRETAIRNDASPLSDASSPVIEPAPVMEAQNTETSELASSPESSGSEVPGAVNPQAEGSETASAPSPPVALPSGATIGSDPAADSLNQRFFGPVSDAPNVIERGDDPAEPGQMGKSQRLDMLGFPKRPRLWPHYMDWPPARDVDMLLNPDVTAEQRKKYIEGLFRLSEEMLLRARQIDGWIEQHDPVRPFREILPGTRTHTKMKVDPFHGIKWACLLDPSGTNSSAFNTVLHWTHTRAVTQDGGVLNVHKDRFSFHNRAGLFCGTEQAVALAIQEGRARGWKTFKVSADPDFAKIVEKVAREMNVHAEIRIKTGVGPVLPFGLSVKRTMTVMSVPPAPQRKKEDDPEEKKDSVSPEPGSDSRPSLKVPDTSEVKSGGSAFASRRASSAQTKGHDGNREIQLPDPFEKGNTEPAEAPVPGVSGP